MEDPSTEVIEYLEANAIPLNEDKITNLTGYMWIPQNGFRGSFSQINFPETNSNGLLGLNTIALSFTCREYSCTEISGFISSVGLMTSAYMIGESDTMKANKGYLMYKTTDDQILFTCFSNQNSQNDFTIYITGGEDVENPNVINWLLDNGILVKT